MLLQPDASAFDARISQSRTVRASSRSLGRCQRDRQQPRIPEAARGADNIRQILRNLSQIAHNLAELRGLYGTGHGRDGQYRGLQPRHARLAVASVVAFVEFVTETYLLKHTQTRASR
ncbi:abortive infection family protein [Delftia tsuruhatensis]|uniref:abortive infection family protein n=1 Tax=Delftia tsuruhatensis TaxID=180282 RepID=UPI003BAE4521